MFTRKEESMLHEDYFEVIRETDQFIEVQSVNTGHCWSVMKNTFERRQEVILYHKHRRTDEYYHKHRTCRTVKESVDQIKSHDEYVLQKRVVINNAPGVENRQLKVYESRGNDYKAVPSIRLVGKCLGKYGFDVGDTYNVSCETGKLVLTKII